MAEPNGGRRENCLQFPLGFSHWKTKEHGFWNDGSCNSRSRPICQKQIQFPVSTPKVSKCPDNWFDAKNLGCYFIGEKLGTKTWSKAQEYCQNLEENSGLAEIYDDVTQGLLSGLILNSEYDYWLGGSDINQVYIRIN